MFWWFLMGFSVLSAERRRAGAIWITRKPDRLYLFNRDHVLPVCPEPPRRGAVFLPYTFAILLPNRRHDPDTLLLLTGYPPTASTTSIGAPGADIGATTFTCCPPIFSCKGPLRWASLRTRASASTARR